MPSTKLDKLYSDMADLERDLDSINDEALELLQERAKLQAKIDALEDNYNEEDDE